MQDVRRKIFSRYVSSGAHSLQGSKFYCKLVLVALAWYVIEAFLSLPSKPPYPTLPPFTTVATGCGVARPGIGQ